VFQVGYGKAVLALTPSDVVMEFFKRGVSINVSFEPVVQRRAINRVVVPVDKLAGQSAVKKKVSNTKPGMPVHFTLNSRKCAELRLFYCTDFKSRFCSMNTCYHNAPSVTTVTTTPLSPRSLTPLSRSRCHSFAIVSIALHCRHSRLPCNVIHDLLTRISSSFVRPYFQLIVRAQLPLCTKACSKLKFFYLEECVRIE
jgi:hypothetical protein